MEKFFAKYQRFLGTIFTLWLFLWLADKLGLNFGVDLRIFFRILFFMFLVLVFREIKKRRVEIVLFAKSVTAQTEIPSALEQYPTSWSKTIHLPLLVFSFSWKLFKKYTFSRRAILFFCILGLLIDIFVFKFTTDIIVLALTGLWIYSIRLYKFEGRVSIAGALFFLALCPFLLIFKMDGIAEKAAIWAYMFLVVGVGQMFLEQRKEIGDNQVNKN